MWAQNVHHYSRATQVQQRISLKGLHSPRHRQKPSSSSSHQQPAKHCRRSKPFPYSACPYLHPSPQPTVSKPQTPIAQPQTTATFLHQQWSSKNSATHKRPPNFINQTIKHPTLEKISEKNCKLQCQKPKELRNYVISTSLRHTPCNATEQLSSGTKPEANLQRSITCKTKTTVSIERKMKWRFKVSLTLQSVSLLCGCRSAIASHDQGSPYNGSPPTDSMSHSQRRTTPGPARGLRWAVGSGPMAAARCRLPSDAARRVQ